MHGLNIQPKSVEPLRRPGQERPRSELDERAAVVAEARTWIKTPYHHCADIKGVGVDCAYLLIRVYSAVGLIEPFDPGTYPIDWMLHRAEERYLNLVLARGRRVDRPEAGDIFVIRYGRTYSHGGIVTTRQPLTAVHAFRPHGIVVEEELGRCRALALRLEHAVFASFWFQ